jgi:hypothetical protein
VWDEIAIGEEGFLVRGEDKRVTSLVTTKWENLRRGSINSARLVVGPTIQDISHILTRLNKLLVCVSKCVIVMAQNILLGEKNHCYIAQHLLDDSFSKKQN